MNDLLDKCCGECEQLAYQSEGREHEGYGFCKLKESWATVNQKCRNVEIGNHSWFDENPQFKQRPEENFRKYLEKNKL